MINKIIKDIIDKENKEMAMAFTNVIGKLLKENGVKVVASRYDKDKRYEKDGKIIGKEYAISVDRLDFTEHDKAFMEQVRRLKYDFEKLEQSKRIDLPFEPLEVANMLINATYEGKMSFSEKRTEYTKYSIDDLSQIAEHLLVYCKYNREDE